MNPDVTVRSPRRDGEVHLLRAAHRARAHQRPQWSTSRAFELRGIQDGELNTACQQACPTEAIVFGNLNDPNAPVTKLHADERALRRCCTSWAPGRAPSTWSRCKQPEPGPGRAQG